MAETFEWIFYEYMWRCQARNAGRANPTYPLPWWVQQYFQRWSNNFDGGLFLSKEGAFASNACFRYWNMIGVKDAPQESLVGQAGEIEPVYDSYAVSFFLFDPANRRLAFPQFWDRDGAQLRQSLQSGHLPVVCTEYESPIHTNVTGKAFATTIGVDQKSIVVARYSVDRLTQEPSQVWFCLAISPTGPSGFQRNDRAGRYTADRRISFLRFLAPKNLVEVNSAWGPVLLRAPDAYGVYGNDNSSTDPDHYIDRESPYRDLATSGGLNGKSQAGDFVAGLCSAVLAWKIAAPASHLEIDVILPIDDFRAGDLTSLQAQVPATLEAGNLTYWNAKLASGLQPSLPARVAHLADLYRICRANLLILADEGAIHPGPTIYDDFWVRDSSVEGIACALAGDTELARRQFANRYPDIFSFDPRSKGSPVSLRGFFGGPHEINDREWDANGEALWAIGKFDRIVGPTDAFGAGLYLPYVIEGARWIERSLNDHKLLPQGWSAEHLGGKEETHYWDHLWAIAGLWEAAKLAERIGAPDVEELWRAYDKVRIGTRDSILWALEKQREMGQWETYIPSSPEAAGRMDSTIIGAVAYYHPCRLYLGQKLGGEVDHAAHLTLETIWARFMDGGLRHDAAWRCYGPYLTLQLAHAFLLKGDIARMDQCLAWTVRASRAETGKLSGGKPWAGALGAWNEQHCYPVASDFSSDPKYCPDWWYMGDIPHGWACGELMLLLRDILFFEADEDGAPHVYVAPGLSTHWLADGESVGISNAPTVFGQPFGYSLTHNSGQRTLTLQVKQPPPAHVRLVVPCRFGNGVAAAQADGQVVPVTGTDVWLPAGTRTAVVTYR